MSSTRGRYRIRNGLVCVTRDCCCPLQTSCSSSTSPFTNTMHLFRLDYISCILTVGSTILIGKKRWEGWLIAGLNSALICVIALDTSQFGFIPANIFCLALYSYNIREWNKISQPPSQQA